MSERISEKMERHPPSDGELSNAGSDRGIEEQFAEREDLNPDPMSALMTTEPSPHRPPSGLAPTTSSPPHIETPTPKVLSTWVKPLVWIYQLFSRDTKQVREWQERIETIEHAQDIDQEPSTEGKAILADKDAWRQVKSTGLIATSGGMGLGALWMTWLVPLYAVGHGFGWLAASAFLLPVPLAWKVGRRLWESAALQGMKELGDNPSSAQQLRTLSSGMVRGMMAGAGMGFTLIFTQALISWFMTPAPTLLIELIIDLINGTMGAIVGATVGAVFGPLVGRPAPSALPASPTKELAPSSSSD